MKQVIGTYAFSASGKTVTLSDFGSVRLDRLQLIVDTTTNKILYNFADSTVATAAVAANVVTLSALPSGVSSSDALQIIYDCQSGDPAYDETPVTLATLIAGENLTSNYLMISNETVLSNTEVLAAVSVQAGSSGTLTNAAYSASVNCSDYRNYMLAGWGASGDIQLLLQVSFDGGTTWLWHPDGQTSSSQQYPVQQGTVTAPLCRVAATSLDGTQNVTSYLCLSR